MCHQLGYGAMSTLVDQAAGDVSKAGTQKQAI